MPEDQLAQLPPELRTMVMTGATAMMANSGAPMMQQMMNPMMASMGNEMSMDGIGVGAQQGQGGPMQDQLAASVEGFGPQGGMGVGMGMAEYGLQVCHRSVIHNKELNERIQGSERDATDATA